MNALNNLVFYEKEKNIYIERTAFDCFFFCIYIFNKFNTKWLEKIWKYQIICSMCIKQIYK